MAKYRTIVGWCFVLNLCFFNFVTCQDAIPPPPPPNAAPVSAVHAQGGIKENGLHAMASTAIGSGIGAAVGALDGPVRAAVLASVGGTLGR